MKMREGVTTGRPGPARRNAHAIGSGAVRPNVISAVFRKAPQSSPHTLRRPTYQQHAIVCIAQHEQARATNGLRAPQAAHRKCLRSTQRARGASRVDRTTGAIGPRAGTDGGAQIHDCLGVVGNACVRRVFFGESPKFLFDGAFGHWTLDGVIACQHALDVAIENGVTLSVCKRQDGAGGGWTDSGEMGNVLEAARKARVVLARHDACRGMQVTRACVVAEAGPEMQHTVEPRLRERFDIRKAFKKALEVGDNRCDLRLLQHDLRDPDCIGVSRSLPRQPLATVPVIPGKQATTESIAHGEGTAAGSCA